LLRGYSAEVASQQGKIRGINHSVERRVALIKTGVGGAQPALPEEQIRSIYNSIKIEVAEACAKQVANKRRDVCDVDSSVNI
jgi:hypothetical protein